MPNATARNVWFAEDASPDAHSWHDLAAIAERHRDFIEGVAEGDCAYNDNCPPNAGTRHYECDVCRARRALNPEKEVLDGPAEPEPTVEELKLKVYWLHQSLHDARQDRILWQSRAFKNGAERMQQAILEILHQNLAPLEVIARVVELDYPEPTYELGEVPHGS